MVGKKKKIKFSVSSKKGLLDKAKEKKQVKEDKNSTFSFKNIFNNKPKNELKAKEKQKLKMKKETRARARAIDRQKRKEAKKAEKLRLKKLKETKQKEKKKPKQKKIKTKKKPKENKEEINLDNLHLDVIKKVEEITGEKTEEDLDILEDVDLSFNPVLDKSDFTIETMEGPEFCLTAPFNMNVVQKQEILEKMGSVKTSKSDILGDSAGSQTKMMQMGQQETVLPEEDVSNISAQDTFDTPLIDESIVKAKDKPKKAKAKKENKEKFIYTSIKGFDTLLEKGIPTGANIIVAGGPGCGKTIFCSQTIYNKAAEGRDCVFLSMEERPDRLRDHMLSFGFNVEEIERSDEQIILRANGKGRISLKRLQPIRLARSIEALLEKASGTLPVDIDLVLDFIPEDFDACLLALDSISAIETAFSGTKRQYRIYIEQLFRYFEEMNLTTFMITESSDAPHKFSNTGVEEFLADGIFVFYNFQGVKKRSRGVEVYKLRGASHSQRIVPMEITSNGMKIDSDESCKTQAQS